MARPLDGRGILITGGSLGIGKAVAKMCVESGADVFLCARNETDVRRAEAELKEIAGRQQVHAAGIDISDPAQAEVVVSAAKRDLPRFSGLVNAAGITGPVGPLVENDIDDWIATIRVNLVGTMLTCRFALAHFREQNYGKIVNFSGGGATGPRPRFSSYACAKVAVVRLTETVAHENQDARIDINAIAPGAVNTRMLTDVLNAGARNAGEDIHQQALDQQAKGGVPPEKAAELCVRLLSGESDGISGRLLSAVWDDWESIVANKGALAGSDVYTLRRIVPKDRGLNW